MTFDERLATRIRSVFAERDDDVSERRMFGGLAFMVRDHMCCGVIGTDLMLRVGPEHHAHALSKPHVRVMDFTGRPSRGMVYIAPAGIRTAAALRSWIARGVTHVAPLPAESGTARQKHGGKFKAALFRYPGMGGWTFVTVPDRLAPPVTHGWGRTPVQATVDGTQWKTSVWRGKDGRTLLAVPKRVRGVKEDGDSGTSVCSSRRDLGEYSHNQRPRDQRKSPLQPHLLQIE